MRPIDIDLSTGEVWKYKPQHHKNAHRGHDRTILIGPRAQEIIRPYLSGRAVDLLQRGVVRSADDDRHEIALLDLARVADVRNAVRVDQHAGVRVERQDLALRAADQRLQGGVVAAFDLHGEAAGVRAGRSGHLTAEEFLSISDIAVYANATVPKTVPENCPCPPLTSAPFAAETI